MSDEILQNQENDETAALFVSAQKKKKAEEEARKKAEEEKAKREAAEAEVKRMEMEVEERKKRAEEEKLALEKAAEEAKNAQASAPVSAPVEPVKTVSAKAVDKSKMPIFIGAGAAAVVVIIIAIFLLKGKGDSVDYASLNMNAEYTSKASGYDIKFAYPDSLYPEVTENKTDDALQILFKPGSKSSVITDVVVSPLHNDKGEQVKTDSIAFRAHDMNKTLEEVTKPQLESLFPGLNITEQKDSGYTVDNPGEYSLTYTFTSDQYKSGKGYAWVEPNSAGEYMVVLSCFAKAKEDQEAVNKVQQTFADYNAKDAFAIPGANPPDSTEVDGMIEDNTTHMGLHVPKDRFTKWEHTTNYCIWSDLNGAMIITCPIDTDIDFSDYSIDLDYEKIMDTLRKHGETGVNSFFGDVESRVLLSEEEIMDGAFAYRAEYKDVIGGMTYWERFQSGYWTDVRTGKHYFVQIITVVPEVNKDIYKSIFDKTLASLEDI